MRRVITYGTFDLFHEGHRRLLERARALGDHLTVGVTENTFDELRGKLGTIDSYETRCANVMATGFVDEVISEDHAGQKVQDIVSRGIDVFTVGSDWTGHFDDLRSLCEVVYLPRTPGISSSAIRDKRFSVLDIGIIGSGRIARRFVPEAGAAGRVNVKGVFNPHLQSAEQLQSQFKLSMATDDLDELLGSVDAVYIATPHETHATYARAALEAGKHVLVEKPMALSESDARELFELADVRGLVLLEAIKTAYCPGFCKLVDLLEAGCIGSVVDVDANFTKLVEPGVRERDDAVHGGSFTELGSYVLLPVLRLLGCDVHDIAFDVLRDERGVDLFTKASARVGCGFATTRTGLGVKTQGDLVISGTKGDIKVAAPWWKTGHVEIHRENAAQVESFDFPFLGDGLRYEISEFAHRICKHEGRRIKLLREESICMASIMERFLDSRGR